MAKSPTPSTPRKKSHKMRGLVGLAMVAAGAAYATEKIMASRNKRSDLKNKK